MIVFIQRNIKVYRIFFVVQVIKKKVGYTKPPGKFIILNDMKTRTGVGMERVRYLTLIDYIFVTARVKFCELCNKR